MSTDRWIAEREGEFMYPLREEGWLMVEPKVEPDDEAPEPKNDPVEEPDGSTRLGEAIENDDDAKEETA
jgi:hypothetical protein